MAKFALSVIGVFVSIHSIGFAQPDFVEPRNEVYRQELEAYFQSFLVDNYPTRAKEYWDRDYTNVESFLKSVKPNRERYRAMLAPLEMKPVGPLQRKTSPNLEDIGAEWLVLPLGPLKAEALLVMPERKSGPVPLVIAQHGIGSYPERVFGIGDDTNQYHDYGNALLEEGFAVLAPFNLRTVHLRNRIERLARLLVAEARSGATDPVLH